MRRVKLTSAVRMDDPPLCGDVNDTLLLEDGIAQFAVLHRLGEYADPEPDAGPSRAELEAQEAAIQAGTLQAIPVRKSADAPEIPEQPKVVDPGDLLSPEARAEADAGDEAPKRPYGNAPKSAWIRYALAVDKDLTQERAETLTKADLMSKYGERLLGLLSRCT